MGLTQVHLIAVCSVAVFYALALTFVSGDDVILQKRSERNRLDMDRFLEDDRPRKRPFCNAFTGCGKKRSDPFLSNAVDGSPEQEVEDTTRQILNEVRLWEAIQMIRAELERRKQLRQNPRTADLPLGIPVSTLRKKRSPTKPRHEDSQQSVDKEQYGRHR